MAKSGPFGRFGVVRRTPATPLPPATGLTVTRYELSVCLQILQSVARCLQRGVARCLQRDVRKSDEFILLFFKNNEFDLLRVKRPYRFILPLFKEKSITVGGKKCLMMLIYSIVKKSQCSIQ